MWSRRLKVIGAIKRGVGLGLVTYGVINMHSLYKPYDSFRVIADDGSSGFSLSNFMPLSLLKSPTNNIRYENTMYGNQLLVLCEDEKYEKYLTFEHSWSDYLFDYILKSFKLQECIGYAFIKCDDTVSEKTIKLLKQELKNRVNIDGGITVRSIERIINSFKTLKMNVDKESKSISEYQWDDYTKWKDFKDLRLINLTFNLSEITL